MTHAAEPLGRADAVCDAVVAAALAALPEQVRAAVQSGAVSCCIHIATPTIANTICSPFTLLQNAPADIYTSCSTVHCRW